MYLIGIDGGGTKTETVVGDLEGNIKATAITGSANLRNVGMEEAIANIEKGVRDSLSCIEPKEVAFIFAGIPCFTEEYGEREDEIKKALFIRLKDLLTEERRMMIGSDQEAAFCSGTDEEDGMVAIAGTGSVVRGWHKEKDVKIGGWGWFADESGAFQIGQAVYQETVKALDGRIKKTLLTDLVLQKMKVSNIKDLNKIIYGENPIKALSPLSILANEGAERGDEVARSIIIEAVEELVISARCTIEKLKFEKDFPFVLVGGMFKSHIFLKTFKEKILSFSPFARIILPEDKPAWGAMKLAIKNYEKIK